MRWVFVRPRHYSPYFDPEVQEPLGIQALAAFRRLKGDSVLVLDAALEDNADIQLARRACSFEPDAIGFSLATADQLESTLAIFGECRNRLKEGTLWLAGGNFITTEARHAQRRLPAVFLLVRFEGELALEKCVRSWRKIQQGNCPALGERVIDGPCISNLRDLPFADRPYARQIVDRGGALNIQGSRGCGGACRYCSSPAMGAKRNQWRGRTPDGIVSEMAQLSHSFGATAFNIVDEDFLGPPKGAEARATAFCRSMEAAGLQLSFSVQVRPNTLNQRIVSLLAKVGLVYVFMGLESDDRDDFLRWRRPWSKDPWQHVATCRKAGVEINVGSLLFHSHSTFSSIRRFAERLHLHGLLDYRTATNRMDAMPGSDYYHDIVKATRDAEELSGPRPLPFQLPAVEALHRNLLRAVAPLGPPSMQAVCSMPPVLAAIRTNQLAPDRLESLRAVSRQLSSHVASSLFGLLRLHADGREDEAAKLAGEHARANLEHAFAAARQLAEQGCVASFEELCDAIWLDARL